MKWPSLSRVRLRYPSEDPTGVDMALGKSQPRFTLWNRVWYFMLDFSAHSARVAKTPLCSITRLVDVLRACSMGVDHLTFPGSYPRSPFMRSIVWLLDGRGPMYRSNESYDVSHSSHTFTGFPSRPPYRSQSLNDGSEHRRIMVFQTSYSGLRMLKRARPSRLHNLHSMQPLRSSLTRTFSGVNECPFLQVPPIITDLVVAIRSIITLGLGGVSFHSAAF